MTVPHFSRFSRKPALSAVEKWGLFRGECLNRSQHFCKMCRLTLERRQQSSFESLSCQRPCSALLENHEKWGTLIVFSANNLTKGVTLSPRCGPPARLPTDRRIHRHRPLSARITHHRSDCGDFTFRSVPPVDRGKTWGNVGTDGTFAGFRELELGVRPACPRVLPEFSGIGKLSCSHIEDFRPRLPVRVRSFEFVN